jgi:hypothetical protein
MKRGSILIVLVSVLVGCTSNASSSPSSSSATLSIAPGLVRVYTSGGSLPTISPDGTTIAFLRDPPDPSAKPGGDPFVLQVWLIHPDGSGMRKLGEEHACCLGAIPTLSWSPDGSSIVLSGIHKHRLDVATGRSLPMTQPSG